MPDRFACRIWYPELFPMYRRRPPKLDVVVETQPDCLAIYSTARGQETRVLAREAYLGLGSFLARRFSRGEQYLELLRASLLQVIGIALFVFVISFLGRGSYGRSLLYYAVLSLLVSAVIVLPLHFVLGGGLAIKQPLTRFFAAPAKPRRPFYLEVNVDDEPTVRAALETASLKVMDWVPGAE